MDFDFTEERKGPFTREEVVGVINKIMPLGYYMGKEARNGL